MVTWKTHEGSFINSRFIKTEGIIAKAVVADNEHTLEQEM